MMLDNGPVWEETRAMTHSKHRQANVRADMLTHGDVMGDGFVIDSVYQPIGNPSAFFAMGKVHQSSPLLFKRFLGYKGTDRVTIRIP